MESCLDFMSAVLDEISLEGLDGITIPTLWVRLQNRPNFPLAIDENSKSYLWKCIAVREELEIYELSEPRATFVPFNRYKFIDEELGIVVEPDDAPPDLYPMREVEDGDIRGSCASYYTRKCITPLLRCDGVLLLSLQEAMEKWSEKLVLVASPLWRRLALFGSEVNPLSEMAIDVYCLLERIGRSRYSGEVTQGSFGLLSLKEEYAKKMHYLRTKLTRRGLITKQLHYSRNKNGVTVKGSLFHLTRFYIQRKCKMQSLVKCICDILKNKPQCRELSRTLRIELNVKEGTFKKLFHKPFQNWFKISTISHREMYPEATDKECITSHGQERMLKVVSLIRPYEEEEEEEEENECEDDGESATSQNCHFDPYKVLFDKTLISQAYSIVYAAGPEGITAQEMRERMSLPRLQIRGLCKTLLKFRVVMTLMQDRGRQRVTRYISKKFEKESETFTKVKEQHQKFLDLPIGASRLPESADVELSSASLQSSDSAVPGDINPDSLNAVPAQSNFQNIESEVIEVDKVQVSKTETKSLPSFGEALKSCEPGMISKRNISLRLLERANKIIETMQSVKVALVHELKNAIVEHEAKEGLTWKMDKKSNLRLLDRLVREGHLKYVKMILKLDGMVKELDFVCHPSVPANDPLMKAAIEQAKFKYFGVSKTSQGKTEKNAKGEAAKEARALKKSSSNLLTNKNVKCSPMEYAPSVGRTVYGLQSKFVRSKYLHLFLFYLLCDYQGIREKHDEPFVHHDSNTWKRFIPPPPAYPTAGEGWCILSDIMLCMPLSIFLKIVNIRYRIFGLNDYLDDPVKYNYLIKHLPQELRNALLCGGRYRWMIFEVVQRLCYMGLVTFGPQVRKDKDQIFVYVHKNASIKDTTVSPPGYIFIDSSVDYEIKRYKFSVMNDLETYWYDLENICLHTNLSRYSVAQGQNICTIDLNHKGEMIKASRSVDFHEVVDDGSVPGDSLGAAGLDSALFAHMKRNWYFASTQNQLLKSDRQFGQSTKSALGKHLMKALLQDDTSKAPHLQNKRHRQRLARNSFLASVEAKKGVKRNLSADGAAEIARKRRKMDTVPNSSSDGVQKHVKIRTVRKKTLKMKRRPYYDDKDKAAMKKMSKQRVDWTPQEDSFLLLCKVASLFLNPKMRSLVVPFFVVRDLLHERFPELSANKSSRACQRRVRYMLLNPITRVNVSVFLGEARQDVQLVEEYDVPKPPKTQEDEWKIMFSNVLKKLLVKFTASAASRCQKMDLPETLSQFHDMYEIKLTSAVFAKESSHQDPKNAKEICLGVMTSVVLSSLCTVGDKLNWSYTLYKLYTKYPEELLDTVVHHLRSEQLITKKRDYAKKTIPVGPMSSLPYRLSVTFANALATKYPVNMFEEAAEFFNKLNDVIGSHQNVVFDGNVGGGYCGAVLSLMSMNLLEFKSATRDQILFLDTSLSEDERQTFIKQLHLSESLEEKVSSFLTFKGKLAQEDHEKEFIERPAKRPKFDESHMGNHSDVETSKQVNVSKYSVEANSSADANGTALKTNRSASGVDTPSTKAASRIALYMLRQEYCLPPTEKAQHSQDYFVINSNPVYCRLKENYENSYLCFSVIPKNVIGPITEVSERCRDLNVTRKFTANLVNKTVNNIIAPYIQYIPEHAFQQGTSYSRQVRCLYYEYSEDVMLNGEQIVDYIYQSRETGVTYLELWMKFRHVTNDLCWYDHISLLRNNFVIFCVGVTCFRYVHVSFVEKWIVSSFIIPKDMRSYATQCMKRVAFAEGCSSKSSNPDLEEQEAMDCNGSQSEHSASQQSTSQMDCDTEQCADGLSSESADGRNVPGDKTSADKSLTESEVISETPRTSTHLGRLTSGADQVVKPKNEELWDHVKFISRVWRKPDGSLNRPTLVKYMTSILGYIMSCPGSSEGSICERFSYVLQPVQTLELLEILEKMECVCKYYVKKRSKATVFSAPGDSFIVTKPEPGNIVHYETAVDAIIKIGKLKEALVLKH